MKVIARYDFERSPTATTRYILKNIEGRKIKNLLPEYKDGRGAYIEFEKNVKSGYYQYGFYIGLVDGKHKRLTGCNFSSKHPERTFGDDYNIGRKDSLLFEFTNERNNLSMWLVSGNQSRKLFAEWNNGGLDLTIKKP